MKKRVISLFLVALLLMTSVSFAFAGSAYTVKSGDVLWKIAQKYNTTWQDLAEINKLANPNLIFPGQIIQLDRGQAAVNGKFKAGTYTAEGQGKNGPIKVSVTVDDNSIKEIKILEHKETPGISDAAFANIPSGIIDGQTLAVDTVSGCTMSSNGILAAVETALAKAGADISALKVKKADTAAAQPVKLKFTPGTYKSAAQGMHGPVPVTVTVSESKIESVTVGENKETLGVGDVAARDIPSRIVEKQSLAVDVVSGATITSFAVINAAKAALQEAVGDIAALTKTQPSKPLVKGSSETVDVVIVGAGLAGINAAYDLKYKNPDVSYILLEKRDVITGSLPLSGGSLSATKSKLHTSMGFESSVSDYVLQMKTAVGGPVREDLITAVFSNSEEIFNRIFDWGAPLYTESNYSNPYVKTNPVQSLAGSSSKVYCYFANGSGGGYSKFYYDLVASNPINLRTHSKVTDLIVSDGKVTGVKVQDKDKEYEIHAKAVLLTTGGFGSNPEYVKQYNPSYVGGINRSNSGATGDGITMTRQFNTPIVGIGRGMISGEVQAALDVPPLSSTFNITSAGNRISRPSSNGADVQYTIVDSKFADKATLQKHIDAKLVEPYNTLEELAKAKGIDPAKLAAAVAANNEAIDAGQSPGFGLTVGTAVKLDSAPYYAERIYNSWSGSYPAPKIDDQMRILDGSDKPVPGLYAAGELTTANFYYGGFPGLSIAGSLATYSGPYAVRNIVKDIK